MSERDYQTERIELLKDMLAAIELCDDDTYADRYDRLLALEKEAGEFDGLDCECELEICPACGGHQGEPPCVTCGGELVVDRSVRPPGGCESGPATREPVGHQVGSVTPLLQPGERLVGYHTAGGCGGPLADLVTCEACRAGVTRCLKCGTVWDGRLAAVRPGGNAR